MIEETPPAPPKSARHVWQFAKRNWFLIILMGFMTFSFGRVAIDLFPVPQTVTLTCLSQHSSFSPTQTFTVRINYSLPITRLGLAKKIREQVTAKARDAIMAYSAYAISYDNSSLINRLLELHTR